MVISNSNIGEIEEVFRLYKLATDYQKTKPGVVPWPEFDRVLINNRILEKKIWKITFNDEIACVFTVTDSDPLIWGEKNNDPAIYIHQIATNPEFRGRNLVLAIADWARQFAISKGIRFIRMDTVGENKKLIEYYQKCGFDFIGLSKLTDTYELPDHYHNATVSLFEIKL